VLFDLVRFHPAGVGTGGWRQVMASHATSCDVYRAASLFISVVFKLWTFTSCHEQWFVILEPLRGSFVLISVVYSGLTFVWVLCILSILCWYLSDLPGVNQATNDMMILYYCLMTKVDRFRQLYGIFLGGLSQLPPTTGYTYQQLRRSNSKPIAPVEPVTNPVC
jgi:hypothetical protein